MAVTLSIARVVAVGVCDQIAAPVLVGVIRPLILLPTTALGCWNPEQIEIVLPHELGHVRRWDNLINLFQRLIESALFFQPAVWFVSGWLRLVRCPGLRSGTWRAELRTNPSSGTLRTASTTGSPSRPTADGWRSLARRGLSPSWTSARQRREADRA